MGTIERKCEYGFVHSVDRCRCTSTHVSVRQVKCDLPTVHNLVSKDETELTLVPLRARLLAVMEDAFGDTIKSSKISRVTDDLENSVSEWLRDFAANQQFKE